MSVKLSGRMVCFLSGQPLSLLLLLLLSLLLWSIHLSEVRLVPIWEQHFACQTFPITVCKFINCKPITTSSLFFDLLYRAPALPFRSAHTPKHVHRQTLGPHANKKQINNLICKSLGQILREERKQKEREILWRVRKRWGLHRGLNNKAMRKRDYSKLTDCLNEIKVSQKRE